MRSDPGNAYLAQDAAGTLCGVGECYFAAGEMESARRFFEESEQAYRALAAADPDDFWNRFNLLLPEFRLAQIDRDVARQKQIAARFNELQRGEGRERICLNQPWAIDIRALIAAGLN
jgi:hypothetical protein